MAEFDPIKPGDIDSFLFDFTNEIGIDSGSTIDDVPTWTCVLSPENTGIDLTPEDRIIGPVSFDDYKTACLIGDMVDGCSYTLTAVAEITDGRRLTLYGNVACTLVLTPTDTDVVVLTIEEFRATFPAFIDPVKYPDPAVAFWISQASYGADATRWGQFYELGLRLYVAHMLAINYMASLNLGAPVGAGIPQSKSVGGVSISYDVQFGSESDAGAWALTIWGNQYLRLLREAGSAPIQL